MAVAPVLNETRVVIKISDREWKREIRLASRTHQLLGRGRVHADRAVEIRYFRAHFDGDGDALNDLAGGRVDNVNAEHSAGRCVDDDLVEGALVRLEMGNRRSIKDMQRLGFREQVPGRERIRT